MKRYLLLITLVLIVAPLVTAGCASPSNPSPSPSTASSTATSSAKVTTSTAAASPSAVASASPTASPTGAATASPTASQQTYTVAIVNFAFQPSTMTIPRGATVMWRNDGAVTHTVTSDTGAFNSGNLSPGATFTHQFNQAGTYPYHCTPHPFMTGTITVQ